MKLPYPPHASSQHDALSSKPKRGEPCNGCSYCCSTEPCSLAKEFLNCQAGPCVALEYEVGRTRCGLVRNPLGYLFAAKNPGAEINVLDPAPAIEEGYRLSTQIAQALGLGMGCDADDPEESA